MYNTLILTQEIGYLDSKTHEVKGNRSCYLIEEEHRKLGHHAKQLRISDCAIIHGDFYYCGIPFDIKPYQAVVVRTWGDAVQKKKALGEIMPLLVREGLYPDNSLEAILSTADKKKMQAVIDATGATCPRSLVIDGNNSIEEVRAFIKTLSAVFTSKSLSADYPAYVVKPDSGTHGNGVTMFFLGQEHELLEYIHSLKESCIVQEYIKPVFVLAAQQKGEACSAHYRIIMSRQSNNALVMIGGLSLQRTGSWVSNTHCLNGALYKCILRPEDVAKEVLESLASIANKIQLSQFGADVIIDDSGSAFILELNDGMGISGELLEAQQIPAQYVRSHMVRLSDVLKPRVSDLLSLQGIYATAKPQTTPQNPVAIMSPR